MTDLTPEMISELPASKTLRLIPVVREWKKLLGCEIGLTQKHMARCNYEGPGFSGMGARLDGAILMPDCATPWTFTASFIWGGTEGDFGPDRIAVFTSAEAERKGWPDLFIAIIHKQNQTLVWDLSWDDTLTYGPNFDKEETVFVRRDTGQPIKTFFEEYPHDHHD